MLHATNTFSKKSCSETTDAIGTDATGTNIKKHLTPVKGRYFSDNKKTARSLYRRGRLTNHSTNSVTGYCSTLVLTEQIRCQSLDLHVFIFSRYSSDYVLHT